VAVIPFDEVVARVHARLWATLATSGCRSAHTTSWSGRPRWPSAGRSPRETPEASRRSPASASKCGKRDGPQETDRS